MPETTAIETAVPEATTEQVTILLGAVLKKTVIFLNTFMSPNRPANIAVTI